MAGLVVIPIALTPDLRDWGALLGPLGTLMSLGSLASAEVWDPLPQLLYCTVLYCTVEVECVEGFKTDIWCSCMLSEVKLVSLLTMRSHCGESHLDIK
jgi:hypothetical protein